ncbi:chloride channel protein [Ancylomarina sp. DW003]|uniref:Chloride channel protein n=1 Tax=Paralabilibaculum antarcticum TaxID=2912572 RepID=A0ABT5VUC2_9BACT|nr:MULTISPECIES: chloride channel protein [Marinifilaceae]MDE5417869.1 chloride channel protein [Labilibaculum sp. DW002]MDE5423018.1 chloride channel protein [Ancylomarina sp. DW003]
MKKKSLLARFLIWRLKHVNDRQFISFLGILIGITSGLAAVVIKNSVHFISSLLQETSELEYANFLYMIYPAIGISVAVLFIKYVIKRPVRHGIPNVLYSISKTNGQINSHNMFSSIVTSAFTVGFGGSVGLEGPTVSTGAALGSNIGRLFHLNYKQTTLLLACACSGAMAAIFKAPIAAIVFAMEVIMLDLTMWSLVPLLLASSTAVITSYFFLGMDVLYPFEVDNGFVMKDLPYYIVLGIFTGLLATYFTKMYMYIHGLFDKIDKRYVKLLIGGLSLGMIIFFFPSLFGEGYHAINASLSGDYSYLFNNSLFYGFSESFWMLLILLALVIFFKVIAASITFGAGGVGGIFAPTLFMGVNAGVLFAKVVHYLGFRNIEVNNFALIGMAGMIAGVLHAPLTGLFLIADISGGYQLFVPLMITATVSYATVKSFEPHSVYTVQLARRKELMTHDKDQNVLSLMRVTRLIEKNFNTINSDATLGDLVKVIAKSQRNLFIVIDKENNFEGIVKLDDIREIMFQPEKYDVMFVRDLMIMPSVVIQHDESMADVARKYQYSDKFNLVVLQDGKYLGCVSRAQIFSTYRRMLKHFSED